MQIRNMLERMDAQMKKDHVLSMETNHDVDHLRRDFGKNILDVVPKMEKNLSDDMNNRFEEVGRVHNILLISVRDMNAKLDRMTENSSDILRSTTFDALATTMEIKIKELDVKADEVMSLLMDNTMKINTIVNDHFDLAIAEMKESHEKELDKIRNATAMLTDGILNVMYVKVVERVNQTNEVLPPSRGYALGNQGPCAAREGSDELEDVDAITMEET